MKRLLLVFALIYVSGSSVLNAQCIFFSAFNGSKIKFTGVAPRPWAIDGKTKDWETILGPGTGNNQVPYNPPVASAFNYSKEPTIFLGSQDLDNPEAPYDIRFMAFTHDDNNVYFYLRKLDRSNKNSPASFYYFCDINSDGFMNDGEPVFGGSFEPKDRDESDRSDRGKANLYVYRYVTNPNVDYVAGKGNKMIGKKTQVGGDYVDGYTMKGSTQMIFSNKSIPPSYALNCNEEFSAEVTEDGYGVEFAVPWKYFRNWLAQSSPLLPNHIFTYHIALQKGAEPGYQPPLVQDNAGNCCKKLLFSGYPGYDSLSKSFEHVEGKTYRLWTTLQNTSNVTEVVYLNSVSFYNIQLRPGIPFSPNSFSVSVPGMEYASGTYAQQPIQYQILLPDQFQRLNVTINPFSSFTFPVDITMPANNSVAGVSIRLNLSGADFVPTFRNQFITCILAVGDAGGTGGGQPIIFEVTTENNRQLNRSSNMSADTPSPDKPVNELIAYPNPSNGSATVVLPGGGMSGELRIENISGNMVYRKVNTTGPAVTLQNLRPGFYLLKYTDGHSGKQYIEKLVVQ